MAYNYNGYGADGMDVEPTGPKVTVREVCVLEFTWMKATDLFRSNLLVVTLYFSLVH